MAKKEKYRVLGVDPGSRVLGYAIVEVDGTAATAIVFDVINLTRTDDPHERLRRIFEEIQQLIRQYKPSEMAVEAPFYGKNIQSMLKLGRAQGVAMAAGIVNHLRITEYSPKKIKQSVTGNGNASKEQVAAMLRHLLQVDLTDKRLDATDALATALCHFFQQNNLRGKEKNYNSWAAFLKEHPDRMR